MKTYIWENKLKYKPEEKKKKGKNVSAVLKATAPLFT